MTLSSESTVKPLKFYQRIYFYVLLAIIAGALLGKFYPETGVKLKPLGDAFIRLIKMVIPPIIFTTVVVGIAGMENLKKVGRMGLKALLYFEVVTTLALFIGLFVVKIIKPGEGMNINPASLDTKGIEAYTGSSKNMGTVDFLMNIIPSNILDAFVKGEILQVLFIAILIGIALSSMGHYAKPITRGLDKISHVFFVIVGMIMKVAPIGAFGAMAFTVGKYGIDSLFSLGKLMLAVYVTCALFIFFVLGIILKICGINLFHFLNYIKEEILLVLGTSSSESALPRMMKKMEHLGCSRSVVGLVIPAGYSFNLDGTSIYLTMATIFIAQATNTTLSLSNELILLGVLMLTSKGAAAVTGGGFITMAATLTSLGTIPVAGITILLGVDRFMSEARAITNLIGNAVATIVVAKWEGELDEAKASEVLKQF